LDDLNKAFPHLHDIIITTRESESIWGSKAADCGAYTQDNKEKSIVLNYTLVKYDYTYLTQ